jgi:hypothetical protein
MNESKLERGAVRAVSNCCNKEKDVVMIKLSPH